jgi:hypothetical protein
MKKLIFLAAMLVFSYTASAQLLAPKGLKVGKTADVITISRITSDGSNIKFYSGNQLLSPEDPDTVAFESVGVLKKDTINVTTGSYATQHDLRKRPRGNDYVKVLNALGAGIKITPILPPGGAYVGGSNQMVDARATYILSYVTDTVVVTTLDYQMHTSGNYTTDAGEFNGMAIYSISGTTATRIAMTANTPTAWSASSSDRASLNLTAPVTLVPGVYFVGFLYNYLAQTTAPYIIGYQPSHVYTALPLNNSLRLGVWVGSQASFPTSFTINPGFIVGILHNFIGR